jgi:hypothetical protein
MSKVIKNHIGDSVEGYDTDRKIHLWGTIVSIYDDVVSIVWKTKRGESQ